MLVQGYTRVGHRPLRDGLRFETKDPAVVKIRGQKNRPRKKTNSWKSFLGTFFSYFKWFFSL